MKLNRKWINEEFVDLSNVSDKDFVETLTVFGQKVETYERLDSEIKNVVVGKVLSMTRHENSDHMWVCQVDVGKDEPVQIVTGAQNVHEGDLVPAALHNSYLPGGVHITKGKLRGVASNGMLCSLKELGLTLPEAPAKGGVYTPCKLTEDGYAYISGCGPVIGGVQAAGKLGQEYSVEEGQKFAQNCMLNVLAVLEKKIGDLNRVADVVKILVFVASADDFYSQPQVANGASNLLVSLFGEDAGAPTRSEVGMNVLPGNIPVEIEAIFKIK